MTVLGSEVLKLKRSSVWVVVVVVPLIAVLTGSLNYATQQGPISQGWEALWGQVTLFYALLFLSLGIAVLGSGVWRPEHQGHNWNQLLTSSLPAHRIVLGKMGVLFLLVAVMQCVFLVLTLCSGLVVLGLGPDIPWPMILQSVGVSVVAGASVVAVQSLLSMLIRPFAVPVGIALLGTILGVGVMLSGQEVGMYVLPYSLVTRSLSLGSSAFTVAPGVSMFEVLTIACSSAITVALCVALSTWQLRRGQG